MFIKEKWMETAEKNEKYVGKLTLNFKSKLSSPSYLYKCSLLAFNHCIFL